MIGAYSFPIVAPLAVVSRAFTQEELKRLASVLRELSASPERDGKITVGESQSLLFPPEALSLRFFGLGLDLPIPNFPSESVIYQFPSLLLCAGLQSAPEPPSAVQEPSCFFRAAMVANMVFHPLSSGAAGYSFEWKIGAPVWLPAYKTRGV
jgi:hypothetical protein